MEVFSIKDHPPEYCVEVLCYRAEYDDWFVGHREGWFDGDRYIESRECIPFDDVTHWAHLPTVVDNNEESSKE